jgi:hypothetical protein
MGGMGASVSGTEAPLVHPTKIGVRVSRLNTSGTTEMLFALSILAARPERLAMSLGAAGPSSRVGLCGGAAARKAAS